MSATYIIDDGPTAHEIWTQAEHSQSRDFSMTLRFRTTHASVTDQSERHYLEPTITSVGHLDETGQMLKISGYTVHGAAKNRSRFTGFYNDRPRSGSFFFGG